MGSARYEAMRSAESRCISAVVRGRRVVRR